MQTQNFKNHSQYVPGFHFITLTLLLLVIIGSAVNLVKAAPQNTYAAALLLALSIGTFLLAFFARSFALKAQDRAIRAEENFRHYIATGQPLDNRLKMSHIIALRFAGDDEFVDLAKKAANENMTSKEIKMAIKNWKPDYTRA